MVAVIVLAIPTIYATWRILDSTQPFPTPNTTTTPTPVTLHYCTRHCGRNVPQPGEACFPRCESPVHDAERILRNQGGAG